MHESQPRVLLFDLGGVLIDIDFDRALRAWQPLSRLAFEGLKQRFRFDEAYERHERGEITAAQYFEHLASTLELDADHPGIEHGWNSIFVGEVTDTLALIRAVRSRIPCHAFTNTNAAHHACWARMFPSVAACLDSMFTSYEMGFRKPERRAFDHVAQALGVPAASIVFFDDSQQNVEGARQAGLQAVHVRSPGDVAQALRAIGEPLSLDLRHLPAPSGGTL